MRDFNSFSYAMSFIKSSLKHWTAESNLLLESVFPLERQDPFFIMLLLAHKSFTI